jgi:predicted nucleic acid-binding protein
VIVVADSSVVLNLCCIDQGDLLPRLFGRVVAPAAVREEFERLAARERRFHTLAFPSWIELRADPSSLPGGSESLDAGERASIALALEIHANAVLIDERQGRQLAQSLGLTTVGVLGILIQAKRGKLIAAVRPEILRLRSQAGFWLSAEVEAKALLLAGE